jgi:hypothetical protein
MTSDLRKVVPKDALSDGEHFLDAAGEKIFQDSTLKRVKPFTGVGFLSEEYQEVGVVLKVYGIDYSDLKLPIAVTLNDDDIGMQWVNPHDFLVL